MKLETARKGSSRNAITTIQPKIIRPYLSMLSIISPALTNKSKKVSTIICYTQTLRAYIQDIQSLY